jgi:hypothetical protein
MIDADNFLSIKWMKYIMIDRQMDRMNDSLTIVPHNDRRVGEGLDQRNEPENYEQ